MGKALAGCLIEKVFRTFLQQKCFYGINIKQQCTHTGKIYLKIFHMTLKAFC